MAFTTIYNDIVFIEGDNKNASRLRAVESDLSFVFGAQLKSLRDVKENLSLQAKQNGANAILDFTYGQKSRWLAIDDVAFWGKGVLAVLPPDEYQKIIEQLKD